MFEALGNLWTAALNEAKVVEGEIVDGVHTVEGKLAPYVPKAVVSTVDQARTKLTDVGSRVIDYVAGNPPGSLQKGIADYKSPASAINLSTSNLQMEIGQYQANMKKLDSWKLTLGSLKSMASKAKADNLVTAVELWISGGMVGGYSQGYNANADALDAAKDLLTDVQSGVAPDPQDAKDYMALKPGASGGFDNANSYAKRIYDSIVAANQKAATSDIPGPADYAMAAVSSTGKTVGIVTGVVPALAVAKAAIGAAKATPGAAKGVLDWVEGAGSKIVSTAENAATGYASMIKYVAIGAALLGAAYLASTARAFAPARHSNPGRRKRR